MKFLFKIEEVFEIPTRGCVIVPVVRDGADFKIRARDAIQLRIPEGCTLNTHIGSVEFLKQVVGSSRMGIFTRTRLTSPRRPVIEGPSRG